MAKEQKFVSVVGYIHNNENEIEKFLDTVMGKCSSLFEKCELILVNDSSSDDSLKAVHDYFDTHDVSYMVSIIKMGIYQGMESSMNAGRDMAIGDYVYEFDDPVVDYDPSIIEEAYRKCLEGHDIVSAACDSKVRFTSGLFYRIYNKASHSANRIGQETFRILSRRAINRVKSMGSYIPYRKAVYTNCGLSYESMVYSSTFGKNELTRHSHKTERSELAMDSFIYFTNVMERVSLAISVVFFVFAIIVLVYVAVSMFSDDNMVSGWVSTMGFMAVGFTGLFGLMTIVLKYLGVIVDLNFRHKRYLIEDVEKISRN